MVWSDPYVTFRWCHKSSHLSHVSIEGFGTIHKQWMCLLAAQHSIALLRGYPISGILCAIWELTLGGNRHSDTHKWQIDAVRGTSPVIWIYKQGFKTLHMQWMSLTAVQHPIGHTERVPKILYFVSNLTFNIGGKLNDDTYRRPSDATTRSPHLPYRSKEGLETVH